MSLQYVQALSNSIQAVTGSPADVSVIGVFPGSNASAVTVVTSVAFPDWSTANSGSLQAYLAVLSSPGATSIYGSQFAGISVDKSSIQISYLAASGKHLGLLRACHVAGPAWKPTHVWRLVYSAHMYTYVYITFLFRHNMTHIVSPVGVI